MMKQRQYDADYLDELEEQTTYEIWLLEYFRSRLFQQREEPNSRVIFTLGDKDKNNKHLLRGTVVEAGVVRISDKAVRRSLKYLYPLTFASAFKLQDMIVEWIIRAHGFSIWRFSDKIKRYEELKNTRNLRLPPLFKEKPSLEDAFWELYKNIEPLRGAIIHTGSFELMNDESLKIKDRNGNSTVVDVNFHASYVRLGCLVLKGLLGKLNPIDYYYKIIESDLAKLSSLHKIGGFQESKVYFERVIVKIPADAATSTSPFEYDVDIGQIRSSLNKFRPADVDYNVLFSLEIIVDLEDRNLTWKFPPEKVPKDTFCIREDDVTLRPFLVSE